VTLDQYQTAAWAFARPAVREGAAAFEHAELGALAEIGEVAGLFQKALRDGVPVDRDRLCAELGDVLWYAAAQSTLDGDDLRDSGRYTRDKDPLRAWGRVVGHCIDYPPDAVSWVSAMASAHGITLADVMRRNLEKLGERAATGTIGGSGEDRAELARLRLRVQNLEAAHERAEAEAADARQVHDRERIAKWLEACARGAETGARVGVTPPPAWVALRQCAAGVRRGAGIPDGPEYDAYAAHLVRE